MLARHLGKIASVTNFIRNLRTFGIFSDSANVLLVLKSIHAALADKTREILFREQKTGAPKTFIFGAPSFFL